MGSESLAEAISVFTDMPHKNLYAWTILLVAHANCGAFDNIPNLLKQMQSSGVKLDIIGWNAVIAALPKICSGSA